jgi:putative SOS response-associated peptidase YedK
MCGRYSDGAELNEIRLAFSVDQLELFREWKPTYNITPSYGPGVEQLVVVRTTENRRALRLARFWLIPPSWPKALKELPTSFNARSEEVAQKPFWRAAFAAHRCLVPATGWREFQGQPGKKQPFHFHFGHRLFAFAGLHSTWISPEGEAVDSFAIVTTEPSAAAAKIHDRMPLVLGPEHHAEWLGPGDGAAVLARARAESLSSPVEIYPSNPIGNSGRFEGPEVLEPAVVSAAIAREAAVPQRRTAPVQGELFGEAPRAPGGRGRGRGRR